MFDRPKYRYRPDHARLEQVKRAFQIARALTNESLSLHELAARCGVTGRTARRYVYSLQLAGVDVECHAEHPANVYRIDRRAWIGLIDLPVD